MFPDQCTKADSLALIRFGLGLSLIIVPSLLPFTIHVVSSTPCKWTHVSLLGPYGRLVASGPPAMDTAKTPTPGEIGSLMFSIGGGLRKKNLCTEKFLYMYVSEKIQQTQKGKTKRADTKHVRQNRFNGKSKTNRWTDDVNIISCSVFRRFTGTRARTFKRRKRKMECVLLPWMS